MIDNKKGDWALFRRIVLSYKPYLGIFIIGTIATFAMSGVDSLLPEAIKLLIDSLKNPNSLAIRWLPVAVIVLSVARAAGSVVSRYCMNRVASSVVMDYRQGIFAKLLRLPARYYDHHTSGHMLSTLLYNTDQIVQAGVDVLVNIFQDGSASIGLLFMMMYSSWRLFLMVLVFGPPIVFVARWASRRMRNMSKRVQQSMGDITHMAEEGIKNYKMIRIYGAQEYETQKFKTTTRKNLSRQLKVTLLGSLSAGSMQIFVAIPLALVFYLFKSMLMMHITPGSLIAFITAMGMLMKPLRRIVNLNSQVQRGFAGAEGVFEILDQEVEIDQGTQKIERVQGSIEYRDVFFQYEKSDKKTLHGISFKVLPGQTVALVGRTGSGKTTIANLLPRFYEISAGQILVDDIDIRDYCLANLRSQFAYVSQNVTLFNDTLANNVAYGTCREASEEEILNALEAANAMDFVVDLPQGIQTLIGENGTLLSGGQRQRVAIARALLKKAPILILDEATSALDTQTEKRIQTALDSLMQSCTSFVIAHRLSTIENADWIVVMDQGQIVEQGTHAMLIEKNQVYAMLYRLQFKEPALVQTAETEVASA